MIVQKIYRFFWRYVFYFYNTYYIIWFLEATVILHSKDCIYKKKKKKKDCIYQKKKKKKKAIRKVFDVKYKIDECVKH